MERIEGETDWDFLTRCVEFGEIPAGVNVTFGDSVRGEQNQRDADGRDACGDGDAGWQHHGSAGL